MPSIVILVVLPHGRQTYFTIAEYLSHRAKLHEPVPEQHISDIVWWILHADNSLRKVLWKEIHNLWS